MPFAGLQRVFAPSRLGVHNGCRFLHGSTANKVPTHEDNRFNILFLGRNAFSCLVFQELHRAQGQLGLSLLEYTDRKLKYRCLERNKCSDTTRRAYWTKG